MSVLNQIAYYQERRDEVPNQETARELAKTRNQADLQEIADNLDNKVPNIPSDCIKVLSELGYLAPELVAEYVDNFFKLVDHRNNRMVWGGKIALSTIAHLQANMIFPHVDEIKKTMAAGSVITHDAGLRILSDVAAQTDQYRCTLLPYLLEQLTTARPVDAPRYAEWIGAAISPVEKTQFIRVLENWIKSAPAARLSRLKKVLKRAEKIS